MSQNFHEKFDADEMAPPSERSTGLVFAVVALIVAFLLRQQTIIFTILMLTALALTVISLTAPFLLKKVNIAWFKFSILLSRITTPIVLFILFSVIIVPGGILMQLLRDPLRKRRPDDELSCWIERDDNPAASSMTNQF